MQLSYSNSVLSGIEAFEMVDMEKLNLLITSDLITSMEPGEHIKDKSYKQYLIKYRRLLESKKPIKYYRPYNLGRVYPSQSLGLAPMWRQVRQTISSEFYCDIDMVNSAPSIIYNLCKNKEIECKYIEKYVNNRDDILNNLMKQLKINKETSKSIMLAITFGGNPTITLSKMKIKYELLPKFLENYSDDITRILKKIYRNTKEICDDFEDIEKVKNKNKLTIFSLYIQNIENQILEEVYTYMLNKNIISNNFVLCFDGIMIPKNSFYPELLNEINQLIKDKFNFDLKFINKEMNDGFTMEQLQKHQVIDIEDYIDNWNNKTCTDLFYKLYPNKYIYSDINQFWFSFEKNNTYLKYPAKIIPASIYDDVSNKLEGLFLEKIDNLKNEYEAEVKKLKKKDMDEKEKNALLQNLQNEFKILSNKYKTALKSIGTSSFIKGASDFFKSKYNNNNIEVEMDSNPNLLAFNNLVYDLSINKFRKIEAEDLISKTTGYDINLERNETIRNDILNIIKSMFNSDEMFNYFLNVLSSFLFMANKLEKLYFFTGQGGNGKSLITNLLNSALGQYYLNADNSFLTTRFESSKPNPTLRDSNGKRLMLISEPDDSQSLNAGFCKKISGKEPIGARGLYESKEISFMPLFTCIICTNQKPSLDKAEPALIRRFRIINFPFNFVDNPTKPNEKKIDYNLKNKLSSKEYINEFILMLIDRAYENRNLREFDEPSEVLELTRDYVSSFDPLIDYLNQYIEITKNESDKIQSTTLHTHYKSKTNINLSALKFTEYMNQHGIIKKRNSSGQQFIGIKFKPEQQEEEINDLDV